MRGIGALITLLALAVTLGFYGDLVREWLAR